jgi:hypothetical protein
MKIKLIQHSPALKLVVALGVAVLVWGGCSKQSAQKAGEGATMGAVVGGVGGLVTGLVFGGNVAESAARGAVYGASTGAAAGAMSSAMAESKQKEQQAGELEQLKAKVGEDAFMGLEALANCKHDVALAYGRTAAKNENKDYALAGLWLQVMTLADSREEDQARGLFPELVAQDDKITSEAQAEEKMRAALQKLMDIRVQHKLPRVCE